MHKNKQVVFSAELATVLNQRGYNAMPISVLTAPWDEIWKGHSFLVSSRSLQDAIGYDGIDDSSLYHQSVIQYKQLLEKINNSYQQAEKNDFAEMSQMRDLYLDIYNFKVISQLIISEYGQKKSAIL